VIVFEIEKNIPVPERLESYPAVYPFDRMEAGDSFFVPNEGNETGVQTAYRVRNASAKFRRKHRPDWRFCTKAKSNGARIWRMK
jgi:hypothetical protein